jgi:hypothetical protein
MEDFSNASETIHPKGFTVSKKLPLVHSYLSQKFSKYYI